MKVISIVMYHFKWKVERNFDLQLSFCMILERYDTLACKNPPAGIVL